MAGPPMTSSYKRRPQWRSNQPTPVNLYWSQAYSAYALKFMDTYHFGEMTPIMSYLKTLPYGEYNYDPDNKIWYFAEGYLSKIRLLLDSFGSNIFTVNFQEKSVNNHSFIGQKQVSVSDYIAKFKNLTGEDLSGLDTDYKTAKKIYRRICMKMHPDIPGNDSSKLSDVNEIWSELESKYFKTKQEPVYE